MSAHELSAAQAIRLVAARELGVRVRGKAIRITTAVFLVVIVGGLILIHALSGGSDSTSIGVAGGDQGLDRAIAAAAQGTGQEYTVEHYASAEEAQRKVDDKTVKAALVRSDGNYTAYFRSDSDPVIAAVFAAAARQDAISHGLDPAAQQQLATAMTHAELTVRQTSPPVPDQGQRLVIAYVAVALLAMSIMVGGQMIAQGVVEEKASRVVELLLATVKPLHLLWGKVIGIGVLVFAQLALYAAAALITASILGLLTITATAYGVVALAVVWFLLGFLFFGTLYAATASLVSRQEDLASAGAPLTVLSMVMVYGGIFGVQFPDTTWVKVLSYIPPFSATLQPMLYATGHTSTPQMVIPIVIAVLACAVVIALAAKIYRNSILHAGARITWRAALSRSD